MRRARSDQSATGRTFQRLSAAAVRVDGIIPEAINSSGSSDAAPAPAKTLRGSSSTTGIPTQTAPLSTQLSPLRMDLSGRRNGAPTYPTRSWFPSDGQHGTQQPPHLQQNNIHNDTHMQDTSTNIELMQQIQNNIVVSMTSLDPQIAAEAWQAVEAARAELSATREAAQQMISQTQQAAQSTAAA